MGPHPTPTDLRRNGLNPIKNCSETFHHAGQSVFPFLYSADTVTFKMLTHDKPGEKVSIVVLLMPVT